MHLHKSLDDLRSALLDLDPTGPTGFEGLLAVALGKVTGHKFHLAGAGSQSGQDGNASSLDIRISFEGKLYSTDIHKNDVLSKAVEIGAAAQPPDL